MSNGNTNQNSVPTRFTTGKVRLTYAFIWSPRSNADDATSTEDKDKKKYGTSLLIPKGDTTTLNNLNMAIQHAFVAGQKKGYWGANVPVKFKLPLRDGDVEAPEKGEEYLGHWFLNASSTRQPRIVDINRQDILTESEVYSGCFARVVLNLFPFNNSGNKGIGCGLEVIQKLSDGEPLGGAPVDLEAALGNWDDGSGDLPFPGEPGYDGPMPASMQGQGYPPQQQAPMNQMGYSAPPQQGYPQQQQGYPQQAGYPTQQQAYGGYPQGVSGSILPQQSPGYPQQGQAAPPMQQAGGYPIQMPGIPGNMPDHFAAGVDAAGQKIGNVFGDEMKGKVA